jgi:transposase
MPPLPLRVDFDAKKARAAARLSKDGPQARRLLALAAIYDGATRSEAARIGGVTVQIVRDWVEKFNKHGPEGLIDRKAPGKAPLLNADHRKALVAIIESGPTPAIHGVVRWRTVDLCQWLFEEFRVSVSKQTLSRELRSLGYRKLSARPPSPRPETRGGRGLQKRGFAAEMDKVAASLPRGTPIEIWWADEARIGQKNKVTRRWAGRPRPGAARALPRLMTNARDRPISSAPSARRKARRLASSCPGATRRR